MYGTTITEMTRRGWTVSVAFEKPDRRGPAPVLPKSAGAAVQIVGRAPHHVSQIAANLRTGIDYVRYLDPAFAGATYLRRRIERFLPRGLRWLTRARTLPEQLVSALIGAARTTERLIPPSRETIEFLRRIHPDILLVTPLVAAGTTGTNQTELVKAAHRLRIPVIVGVASWDHLTSKGLVRIVPDALLVWNEVQRREAVRLHRVAAAHVIVTGAQPLDHWFEPASQPAVAHFRQNFGIDGPRLMLLVVGSSRNVAPGDSEVLFVRRWLAAIRASQQPGIRDAFVVVRPHPGNTAPWAQVDLGDPAAVIHPRSYAGFPLNNSDIELFRCSLAASTAVVGVNTTAMIEAAIMQRPVFTVHDPAFVHSQEQTLHFGYLEQDNGGFAIAADCLTDHVAQLEKVLTSGQPDQRAGDRFVERFVRPLGMQQSATRQVCDAIERVAAAHVRRHQPALQQAPVSAR